MAFAVVLPYAASPSQLNRLSSAIIFAIIGLSLVVLTGWAGQVSLGQMGFVGIAGAIVGTLTPRGHWDIGLVLLASRRGQAR